LYEKETKTLSSHSRLVRLMRDSSIHYKYNFMQFLHACVTVIHNLMQLLVSSSVQSGRRPYSYCNCKKIKMMFYHLNKVFEQIVRQEYNV